MNLRNLQKYKNLKFKISVFKKIFIKIQKILKNKKKFKKAKFLLKKIKEMKIRKI